MFSQQQISVNESEHKGRLISVNLLKPTDTKRNEIWNLMNM